MNKRIGSALFAVAISLGASMGIPRSAQAFVVVCANCSNVVTQIAEYAKQLEQFREMVAQTQLMTQQLTQLQDQYHSITDRRGYGRILTENYDQLVPHRSADLLGLIFGNGPASDMARFERDLLDQRGQPYMQHNIFNEARDRVGNEIDRVSNTKALNERLYEGATDRFQRIDALRASIDSTDDLKGITEVQARLTAESVAALNELVKLTAMNALQGAQDERQKLWYRQRNFLMTSAGY